MAKRNEDNQNEVKHTELISSNLPIDTELRDFQGDNLNESVPGKSRIVRLYMPQKVEPLILIDVDRLIIGRTTGENRLDVSLHYAKMLGVSRDHAEISFVEGQYFITDLNSANGTFLNNRKLEPEKAHLIEGADQIRFGHFVTVINFS